MDSPKYNFSTTLYDAVPTSTESQDYKKFEFPTIPLHEGISTQLGTGSQEDDDIETVLEEVVKITRHRTLSSEQNDDVENPLLQCCLCGIRTLDRCSQCNWAAYCSVSCYNLHRPIHQFFCVPNFVQLFPRLTGLDVVPIHSAVRHMQHKNRSCPNDVPTRCPPSYSESIGSSAVCDVGSDTADPVLTESALIQLRARIILDHVRKSDGRPMCAICGDPCNQSNSPGKHELSTKEYSNLEVSETKTEGVKEFSGDAKDTQPMPQRLVRFGGMLVCTTCVEIQAATM